MPERFSPEYRAHLASPLWHHKREQAFKEHGAYCQRCYTKQALDVHHLTYKHLGAEHMDDLTPLCRSCHHELHRLHDLRGGDLWHFSKAFIDIPPYPSEQTLPANRTASPKQPKQRAAQQVEAQQVSEHKHARVRIRGWYLLWLIPLMAIVWLNAVATLTQR